MGTTRDPDHAVVMIFSEAGAGARVNSQNTKLIVRRTRIPGVFSHLGFEEAGGMAVFEQIKMEVNHA
jgi:hypothetical protein